MTTYQQIKKGGSPVLADGALKAFSDEDPKDDGSPGTSFAEKYAGKDATEEHIASTDNPHSVTKAQVGLGNADNTADLDKPVSTATQTALGLKQDTANMVGTLEGNLDGKYPSATLLKEAIQTATANFKGVFGTFADVPASGLWPSEYGEEPTKNDYMVVLADENHLGTTWRYKYAVEIPPNTYDKGLWFAEYPINTTSFTDEEWNAIRSKITETKVTGYDNHLGNTNNPHSVTKTQVGLGDVDNTSDVNKPISTATQTALDNKANSADVYTKTETDNKLAAKQNKVLSGTTKPTSDIGEDGDIYILYSE